MNLLDDDDIILKDKFSKEISDALDTAFNMENIAVSQNLIKRTLKAVQEVEIEPDFEFQEGDDKEDPDAITEAEVQQMKVMRKTYAKKLLWRLGGIAAVFLILILATRAMRGAKLQKEGVENNVKRVGSALEEPNVSFDTEAVLQDDAISYGAGAEIETATIDSSAAAAKEKQNEKEYDLSGAAPDHEEGYKSLQKNPDPGDVEENSGLIEMVDGKTAFLSGLTEKAGDYVEQQNVFGYVFDTANNDAEILLKVFDDAPKLSLDSMGQSADRAMQDFDRWYIFIVRDDYAIVQKLDDDGYLETEVYESVDVMKERQVYLVDNMELLVEALSDAGTLE